MHAVYEAFAFIHMELLGFDSDFLKAPCIC
jgi:hypothetical protein